MAVLTHIHTYKKFKNNKYNNPNLYQCVDPYCTHFDHRDHIIGKAALCPFCTNEFILTKEDLRRTLPRCINCSNTKKAAEKRVIDKLIENLPLNDPQENL